MAIRATYSVGIWQQRLKPPPHHIGCFAAYLLGLLVVGYLLSILAASIMVIARPGLMPASPGRPAQKCCHVPLEGQDQLPEQMPYLGTTQPDTRLRLALKLAKLLDPTGLCIPFFGAAWAPVSSRMTLKKACAHIAKVMWRYHPVKERTS